jgi:exonuclease SbcC
MISRIIVENFQAHKRLDINHIPGILSIVGDTDAGKSAVVRALQWVALNRPKGKDFIHHGEAYATVTIEVDGRLVSRTRRGSGNEYRIDGKVLKAFGSDVPDEVRAALRMEEVNFQSQHDGAFWFTLSPGQVAKEVNKICDLAIVDDCLRIAGARHRKFKTLAEDAAEREREAAETAEGLQWVSDAAGELSELERMASRLDSLTTQRPRLLRLLRQLKSARSIEERSDGALQVGREALNLAKTHRRKAGEAFDLRKLISQYSKTRDAGRRDVPSLDTLEESREEWDAIRSRRKRLAMLVADHQKRKREAEKTDFQIRSTLEEIEERTGGLCPTCGNPLDP